jgi:pyruvate formate lyase activating enzyme
MKIAGFKKQSLIDYPGNISAVVFTQGCNFRCGFCHNPDLVLPEKFGPLYQEHEVFDYLKRHKKLLDAVCITGGEPTLHYDLPDFIRSIKMLGLKVKLDTNGTNPDMLWCLLQENLLNFVAMDIKQVLDFDLYKEITGGAMNKKDFSKVLKSVAMLERTKVGHEFRTTVIKGIHKPEQIADLKQRFGVFYKIQNFNPEVVLDPGLKGRPFTESEFRGFL